MPVKSIRTPPDDAADVVARRCRTPGPPTTAGHSRAPSSGAAVGAAVVAAVVAAGVARERTGAATTTARTPAPALRQRTGGLRAQTAGHVVAGEGFEPP